MGREADADAATPLGPLGPLDIAPLLLSEDEAFPEPSNGPLVGDVDTEVGPNNGPLADNGGEIAVRLLACGVSGSTSLLVPPAMADEEEEAVGKAVT